MKTCRDCKLEKDISKFYQNVRLCGRVEVKTVCVECYKRRSRNGFVRPRDPIILTETAATWATRAI